MDTQPLQNHKDESENTNVKGYFLLTLKLFSLEHFFHSKIMPSFKITDPNAGAHFHCGPSQKNQVSLILITKKRNL